MTEDYPGPKPHPTRRPRWHSHRRTKLISLLASLACLLIILTTKSAPAEIQSLIPAPIRESIEQTTQTIQESQPGLWRVAKAVDGDTINVEQGRVKETVRLLGVDTPETHDPRKPVQCFGEAAATHTKQLLEGKSVRLEPDPTNSDRDKYHRLLRYVYLPDGTLVNAELLRDGYAFAYTIFPLEQLDEFRQLEQEAREQNRGLWAGCNIDESDKIKQTTSAK